MNNLLTVSPSPHIRHPRTTASIMGTVLLALAPAALASVILFGINALLVIFVSNLACALFEFGWCKLLKLKNTVCDLSCFVTGTLLALTLPANMGKLENLWTVVLGAFISIIIVKEFFGGIGYNFANPAITARIVLFICFPNVMSSTVHTSFTDVELASGATPLGDFMKLMDPTNTKPIELPSLSDMFLGNHAGALGEVCGLALVIGGIILIATKVISWHIPVAFIGTTAIFTFLTCGFDVNLSLFHICAGGLLLSAIFMATDYVTSPDTALGKIVFGIGCGLITGLIRVYGAYPEGVSFAILLMNILNPYIIKLTRKKAFGGVKS